MLQLHLLIEASGNMFIAIVCISVCDIINFEICFSFLVKPFSCIIKKNQDKNANVFNEGKSFSDEIKIIYHF